MTDLEEARRELEAGRVERARSACLLSPPSATRSTLLMSCALAAGLQDDVARHAREVEQFGVAPEVVPLLLEAARKAADLERGAGARIYALACGAAGEAQLGPVLVALGELAARGAPVPLGPFLLEERIGTGAAGDVWRARHGATRFPVAVKILRDAGAPSDAEVRAVATLDHPHIAWLYDHGTVGRAAVAMNPTLRVGSAWLASEWAGLGTLESRVGLLHWPDLRRLVLLLLDALAHAHARGVLHLDLKPSNILLAGDAATPSPKLADFGIARRVGDARRTIAGTPAYMAPEQFLGDPRGLGPWTDLYALGGTVHELLSGSPPYGLGDLRTLRKAHVGAPAPTLVPFVAVPRGLEAWLHRLLAKLPEARFSSASEAAAALALLGEADRTAEADRRPLPLSELTTLILEPSREVVHTPIPTQRVVGAVPSRWERAESEGRRGPMLDASLGLLALRAPPFRGRTTERSTAWACLRSVGDGARALVLVGAPGSGRSRLGGWLVERALELGVAEILTVEPGLQGLRAGVSRWLAVDGLRGDALRAAVTGRIEAEGGDALEVEAWVRWLGSRVEDDRLARRLVGRRLARRARDRTVLVWIDDADDQPAALALADEVAGGPSAALVVLALRDPPGGLGDREGRPGWTVLRLGPMDPSAVATLLHGVVPLSPELANRIVDLASGSPRLAVELVRSLASAGTLERSPSGLWSIPSTLPLVVEDLDENRLSAALAGLPSPERRGAVIVAALGAVVDEAEVRAACLRAGAPDPAPVLERLVRAGLVAAGRWVSPARATLAAEADAALHLACAEALRDLGQAGVRVGRHLLQGGDPSAIAYLQRFTNHFVQQHPAEGAALLDRISDALAADQVGPGDRRWGLLVVDRAVHAKATEDHAGLESWLARARSAGAVDVRIPQLEGILRMQRGDLPGAEASMREAQELGPGLGVALREQLFVDHALAYMAHWAGRPEEAILRCEALLDRAATIDDASAVMLGGTWYTLGLSALHLGRLPEADEAVRRGREILGDEPAQEKRQLLAMLEADIAFRRGDLELAEAGYLQAARLCDLGGHRGGAVWVNLALVRVKTGRLTEALDAVHVMFGEPGPLQPGAAIVGRALLLAEAATVDEATWRERISQLGDPSLAGPDQQSLATALEAAAAALQGQPERAAEVSRIRSRVTSP